MARINKSFSSYFQKIGCTGQVDLVKDENDYKAWAIGIKVKFRDEDATLHELNKYTQSGGVRIFFHLCFFFQFKYVVKERSVSTMLYLISLQDLTPCPFRLVDEINQGMDPYNERMIFDVVAETSCQPDRAQYFLLTPKLLPDLKFNEKMTILCVFNGPWQVPQKGKMKREFHLFNPFTQLE